MNKIPSWALVGLAALVLCMTSACARFNEPRTPQQAVVEQLNMMRNTDAFRRLASNSVFLAKPIENAAVVVFSERSIEPTNPTLMLGIAETERTSHDWRTAGSMISELPKENRSALFSTFQAFANSDHRIIFGRTLISELTQVELSMADGQSASTTVENNLFAFDVSRSVTPCQIEFFDAAKQSRFVIKTRENLTVIEDPVLRERIEEKCQ